MPRPECAALWPSAKNKKEETPAGFGTVIAGETFPGISFSLQKRRLLPVPAGANGVERSVWAEDERPQKGKR